MTYFDLEELAMFLTGLSDDREEELPEKFQEKYGIDLDDSFALIKDLLPLCMVAKAMIGEEVYQGFATNNTWLIKRELIQSRIGKPA